MIGRCSSLAIYLLCVAIIANSSEAGCISGTSESHSSCLPPASTFQNAVTLNQNDLSTRHNYYRASAQMLPQPEKALPTLPWNDDLATAATAYAAQCIMGHDAYANRNVPSMNWNWVGQNLFYSSSSTSTINQIVDAWGQEKNDWAYGTGSTNGKTVAHYTQLVWNTTTHVGCGAAYCTSLSGDVSGTMHLMVVCNYGPAGNSMGSNFGYPYYAVSSGTSSGSGSGSTGGSNGTGTIMAGAGNSKYDKESAVLLIAAVAAALAVKTDVVRVF